MSHSPIIDVHVHVLPDAEGGGKAERDPYEIWEYGAKDDVKICELAGTISQVAEAMQAANCDHFVAVNMFVPDAELVKMDPDDGVGAHNEEFRERLVRFNTWALDLARSRTDMTTFVAMDPFVLGGEAGAEHLRWAAERGAMGFKVHPVLQHFHPDDPRMDPILGTCEELGLGVISHAGASPGGVQWAEPLAFASVLDAHPALNLVLAHLGGGHWRQTCRLAEAYPTVCFDLCEIIAWCGAPGAPTREELSRMIQEVGVERVMFGTDFPWYGIEQTVEQVLSLPLLSDEERALILGVNAVERLGLPVAI